VTQLKATTSTTDEKNPETVVSAPNVPSFAFFCNLPQWVKDPYRRYLENKIREKWDFSGTPINIFMREK
jgi:GTP-binding protein